MRYAIFVERIFDDDTFASLKEFIERHGKRLLFNRNTINLYCLTPVNYELVKAEQGFKGSKKQLEKIMLKRYKELELYGCTINLHLHISLRPDKLSRKQEEKMFKESSEWLNKHFETRAIDFLVFAKREVMFGWYIYSKQSLELAQKYNLEHNKNIGRYHLHCYELEHPFRLMLIIQNLRGLLR